MAREPAVDAVKHRDIEQGRYLAGFGVALVQIVVKARVVQEQVALLVIPSLVGGLRDLLVREFVEHEVARLIPWKIITREVDELIPVVAGHAAEAVRTFLHDDDVFALVHCFKRGLNARKPASDDADVGLVHLVVARTCGAACAASARCGASLLLPVVRASGQACKTHARKGGDTCRQRSAFKERASRQPRAFACSLLPALHELPFLSFARFAACMPPTR